MSIARALSISSGLLTLSGPCSLAADALLRLAPRGAYTTARTNAHRARVFELETHVTRLAQSAQLMMESEGGVQGLSELTSPVHLRPAILQALRSVVSAWGGGAPSAGAGSQAPQEGAGPELKLTILLVWGSARVAAAYSAAGAALEAEAPLSAAAALAAPPAPWALLAHATALPPRRSPPIRALVLGAPRELAAAKDSEWVRARTALEAARGADEEEVLLLDAEGCITEGTQTNLFVVDAHGTLCTAPEGAVLGGTVRRLVLELCAREGIPVSLRAPALADAGSWAGAFLTSTSRLVLPLDELRVLEGEGGERRTLTLPSASCALLQRLEALVASEVEAHSGALTAE